MGWQVIRGAKLAMACASDLSLPIWLGHGEEDALTGIKGSKTFLSRVASKDVTFRPIPEARHEILNEPEGALLTDEIKNWILARC
jgi:alpha-beta hydrolase superfamily lysophospholipase